MKYVSLFLSIKDKPDVAVSVTNTTATNVTTDVRCEAHGLPDRYTYITWEHTWPGHALVLRSYPGSEVLHLNNLTYEYSGFYTCKVENGVQASRNPRAGAGKAYLLVEGNLSNTMFYSINIIIILYSVLYFLLMDA